MKGREIYRVKQHLDGVKSDIGLYKLVPSHVRFQIENYLLEFVKFEKEA